MLEIASRLGCSINSRYEWSFFLSTCESLYRNANMDGFIRTHSNGFSKRRDSKDFESGSVFVMFHTKDLTTNRNASKHHLKLVFNGKLAQDCADVRGFLCFYFSHTLHFPAFILLISRGFTSLVLYFKHTQNSHLVYLFYQQLKFLQFNGGEFENPNIKMFMCVCAYLRLMLVYMDFDFNTGLILQTRPRVSFSIRLITFCLSF